jgi:hypothetical protein
LLRPTFIALNPDLSNAGAEFLEWTLTQYLDKAGNFSGKAAGDIPITRDGWLDVLAIGKIIFRGFIDTITQDEPPTESTPGSQSVNAKDLWGLLDNVNCQFYEYPAGTTILDMLSSDAPTPGKVLGLLWQLNSNLPQGEGVYTGSNEIYKYSGFGTLSRCGTAAIYVDTTSLSLGSSATTLTRGQYFRDSQDLWIRTPDGRDPKYWIVSITNYRDTRLRRGTITTGTHTYAVPYRISKTNFRDVIEKIILALGCEREMDHRAGTMVNGIVTVLGLTYLNLKTLIGRGSLTAPVSEFKADNVNEFHEETTGGDVFNSIIGAGPGSGYTQVVAAKSNMNTRGAWREKTYTSSVLGELLSASLSKIWTDTADPRCWTSKGEADLSLFPGDYVSITPKHSQNLIKRVKQIIHRSDETMDAQINQRILEPEDYMRARATLLSEFNSFIATQKTSWSSSFGPTNIDDSDNVNREFSGSAKFTINIPTGTIDTEFATKFYLRMDIAAYESSIESSATPAHDNGGVTGSHAGYGGPTSSMPQTAHQIPSTATQATGGTYATVSLYHHVHGYNFTTPTTGSHGHISTISNSATTDDYQLAPPYQHRHNYWMANTGVAVQPNGDHQHTINTSTGYGDGSNIWNVAGYDHTHPVYSWNTNAAANQSHDWSTTAKDRAVFTEPQASDILQEFKSMKETGNSIHYLDVYVTMNGNPISGSPFPNLYIGNSISDVDVSSLMIVGDNDLEVSIKEHTSSSIPVRCAIRGSINATYYLPPNSL